MALTENQRVRLIGDPGRIGILTGRTRERAGLTLFQVRFPDTTTYTPQDQLEPVGEEREHPLDLFEAGDIGPAIDLQRALTHVRLSGELANILYSLDTTGTDFYAYQFKPVVKLLNSASPRPALLCADEVGLGKTIEAGLIWTELRARFDFRRLLILCPAMLRQKWQDELRNRFGVHADIMDAKTLLHKLQAVFNAPKRTELAAICSLQGLRPRKNWRKDRHSGGPPSDLARFLDEVADEHPLVDLLVIDEAHYLRNRATMTHQLGRLTRAVANHAVFLSATPVHLHSGDLYNLLNLLDGDTFDHPAFFQSILAANAPLIRARDAILRREPDGEALNNALEEARQHPLLESSLQLRSIIRELHGGPDLFDPEVRSRLAYRLDHVNLLGHVLSRTRKREVSELRVVREPKDELIPMSPAEAAFYERVTKIVRTYAKASSTNEAFLAVMPQRQMASSMPAALESWQQRSGLRPTQAYEDFGTTDLMDEAGPLTQEILTHAQDFGNLSELRASDSKYTRLSQRLFSFFGKHPAEKVLIFSYFRATLHYLLERLEADGIPCFLLIGGGDAKEKVVHDYRNYPDGAVLLSSEVGSEGIDLQFGWVIINYDLPWNPMKIEQRIGRVDRLGQQSSKVLIWNLVYGDTIDARIHQRLLTRLHVFERSLGGLEPILAEEISELAMDLFSNHLSPEQEADRIDQTAHALETRRQQEEELEDEAAHLVAYGDYIARQVHEARNLRRSIGADDLRTYVIDFLELNYPGCSIRRHAADLQRFNIALSPSAKNAFSDFLRQGATRDLTRLTRNGVAPVPCIFKNTAVSTSERNAEIISQFHPIVRFARNQIEKDQQCIYPAAAITVRRSESDLDLDPGHYVFSIQRWSISGVRSTEQLHFAGAFVAQPPRPLSENDAEHLVVEAALHGEDWIGHWKAVDHHHAYNIINEICLCSSDLAFGTYVKQAEDENEDRADLMVHSVDQHWQNRKQSILDVLENFKREGNTRMVPATEGKLAALKGRIEERRAKIEMKRKLTSRKIEVAVGLIHLTQ